MDMHLFFEGNIGREIMSSALLATVLEQFPNERSAFFELLRDGESSSLIDALKCCPAWNVAVEHEQIDIHLASQEQSPRNVVLIENKIAASAKQKGQLLRYYAEQKKAVPGAQVLAVYLAPGGVGRSEVELVKEQLQAGDAAVHISWEEVLDKLCNFGENVFVNNGLEQIRKVIQRYQQEERHPLVAGRERIAEVVSNVRALILRQEPTLAIMLSSPWRDHDMFIVGTQATNMTVWLRFRFEVEPNTDRPLNPYGQDMTLRFQSMFKLSGETRGPELKARWRGLENKKELNVDGVGLHKLEGRWFSFEKELTAPPSQLEKEFAKLAWQVLRFAESWGFRESKGKEAKAVGGDS